MKSLELTEYELFKVSIQTAELLYRKTTISMSIPQHVKVAFSLNPTSTEYWGFGTFIFSKLIFEKINTFSKD